VAAPRASARVLALIEPHVEPEADPATPQFDAAEARVVDTGHGRIDERRPLRRVFREVSYPVTAERVLSSVRSAPDVDEEQARWLEGVLPSGTSFASERELVERVGAWGPPPPATPPSL
jgi:hypothetical protein